MTNSRLKYLGYSIVFQEVPNEVSLAINISGCPHRCKGCHSEYLWEYKGGYIYDDIEILLNKYSSEITCVCFMGGDQNSEELKNLILFVKHFYKLKVCVYSGFDYNINDLPQWCYYCDYLKIGSYKSKLGGLNSKTTNQRFYKNKNNVFIDITNEFQRRELC